MNYLKVKEILHKKYILGLIIGMILIFIGTILSFCINSFVSNIIYLIGIVVLCISLIMYVLFILKEDKQIKEFLLYGIAMYVFISGFSIVLGRAMIKTITYYFSNNKNEMYGYYSSLISGAFSGIIGVAGAIIGAKIGADKSYKAAMDSISKQIEYDREKLNKEKEEEKNKAQQIIDSLLKYEITYNFNKLIVFDTQNRNILINHFKKENSGDGLYNYFSNEDAERNCCFRFNEFNNIKYTYLNYMSEEIVHIYQMFRILEDKKLFIYLTQNEYKYVASTYLKYYDKYRD